MPFFKKKKYAKFFLQEMKAQCDEGGRSILLVDDAAGNHVAADQVSGCLSSEFSLNVFCTHIFVHWCDPTQICANFDWIQIFQKVTTALKLVSSL